MINQDITSRIINLLPFKKRNVTVKSSISFNSMNTFLTVIKGLNEPKDEKHVNMVNPPRKVGCPKRNCVSSWEPIGSAAK